MAARLLDECRAQATVEMALVTPVLIVVALIVWNLMTFASAVARFDRVAPDAVIAHGVSPAANTGAEGDASYGGVDAVERDLARAMEGYDVEVEVVAEDGAGGSDADGLLFLMGALRTYRCTLRFRPWPQGFLLAGVRLGAPAELTHERAVTVDPWRPGVVL